MQFRLPEGPEQLDLGAAVHHHLHPRRLGTARGLVIDYLASVELLPGVTVGYEGAEHLREGLHRRLGDRYTYVASKTGQDLLGGCDPAGEVLYRSRWF